MSRVTTDAHLTAHVQAAAVAVVEAYPTEVEMSRAPVVDVAHTVLSAIDADRVTAVLLAHLPQMWSSGSVECSCDDWAMKRRSSADWHRSTNEFRGDAVRAHAAHQAGAVIASFVGGVGE